MRQELRDYGVRQIACVTYRHVDDAGLHITVDGRGQVLDVDHVVVCAGQVENADLATALTAAGPAVHVVGGARLAGEVPGVFAVASPSGEVRDEGRLALDLDRPEDWIDAVLAELG